MFWMYIIIGLFNIAAACLPPYHGLWIWVLNTICIACAIYCFNQAWHCR